LNSIGTFTVNSGATNIAATGDFYVNSSGGIINIGNNNNSFPINIGTGSSNRNITIGNNFGTSQLNLTSGTNGTYITSNMNSWNFNKNGIIYLPATGDIYRNGSSVLGIGSASVELELSPWAIDNNMDITTYSKVTIRNTLQLNDINNNVGIGYNVLYKNTTGTNNVAIGYNALKSNTTGSNNIASGQTALYSNTTGGNNIASGQMSLYSNTTGTGHIAFGYQALYSNVGGYNNYAIGYTNLYSNTIGYNNIAFGVQTMTSNTIGSENIGIGTNANASFKLNVGGGINATGSITTGTNLYNFLGGLRINGGDTGNTIWQDTGDLGIFANTGYSVKLGIGNGGEKMRIHTNGYIGINTTTP
jgi:hypothetical protein